MAYRRRYIPLVYTMGLIALLLAAALAARIPLAEMIFVKFLQSAGAEDPVVEIRQIGMNRISLSTLEFGRISTDAKSRVSAHGISIDYRPSQLADGRIEHLSIASLVLRHEITATAPVENGEAAGAIDSAELLKNLNTDWRRSVPLNSMAIEQIDLEGDGFGILEHSSLKLLAQNNGADIETRLLLLNRPGSPRLLRCVLNADSLEIELKTQDRAETSALKMLARPTASGIDIRWTLEPERLQAWHDALLKPGDIGSGQSVEGGLNIEFVSKDRIVASLIVDAARYEYAGYRLLHPSINLVVHAGADLPPSQFIIQNGSHARVAGIEAKSLSIGNTHLKLQGTYTAGEQRWSASGSADIPLLFVSYGDYAFELKNFSNHLNAGNDSVLLHSKFAPANIPGSFMLELEHLPASESGTAVLRMPDAIDLNDTEHHLALLLTSWPFSFDLASGSLKLRGKAAWSNSKLSSVHAGFELVEIGGFFDKLLFSGLNFRHELDLLPETRSSRTGELSVAHIDAGVAVQDLNATIGVLPSVYGMLPRLHVRGLRAALFNGLITAEPFLYDLNTPANAMTIHMHDIDLAAVVSKQQFKEIDVSGRVSGILPVQINPYGVFIDNGSMHNVSEQGFIRYSPPAESGGLGQNALAGIALKALSDFRYEKLNAKINFVPDGTLSLGFELNGTSPPLQTNRPVNLNLNIEQNLLSLLKSIRYVDGLNQGLDDRVQQMYREQTGD